MKYALGTLLVAGGLALSIGVAKADPLTLTSPQIQDNGTLAVKNACSDKQRSPNCVGENVSPPLACSASVASRPMNAPFFRSMKRPRPASYGP